MGSCVSKPNVVNTTTATANTNNINTMSLGTFDKNNGIADSMVDLIGQTPMVYLNRLNEGNGAKIALKLESENPMGSVKDRLALGIFAKSERDGKFIPGKTVIVEATSGNTGIALAHIGAIKGYRVIITMPETMSLERRTLLKILGAEVVLTPGSLGMKGAIAKAKQIVSETDNAVLSEQFSTSYNAEIHEETTGPEIWKQTQGKVDFLVAGTGTGGTITGTGRYLLKQNPDVKIVAVEPSESAVLSGSAPGPHRIQGIGPGFIPDVLDTKMISEVIKCPSDEAMRLARALPQSEGIFCGFSGGACVSAALELAKRPENAGKLIVAIIPSYGERYLSTALFEAFTQEAAALPTVPASEITIETAAPIAK